jgi:hypothetical protein
MNISAAVLLGALAFTLTDFVKSARGRDVNGVVTQVTAWAIGLIVVFLGSAAHVTSGWKVINGVRINDLDVWSKVIVGVLYSSLFGFGNQIVSAIDGTRSSAKPQIVPPPAGRHVAQPDGMFADQVQ